MEPVVIVGGGLAGLAAAESISRLAPNVPVTLVEAKRRTGGRAGSFDDPQGGQVDYCQHVAMGCCGNLLDLMERTSLLQHWHRDQSLTFLHPGVAASRFRPHPWLLAPFHMLPFLDALKFLSHSERREIRSGLVKLARTPSHALSGVVATDWLRKVGQTETTIQSFWNVILVSALGEQCDRVSMAAARKVLIDGFAIARGASDVLIPMLPLAELFGQRLPEVLRQRGIKLLTETRVEEIRPDRTVLLRQVGCESEFVTASAVVSAVPWFRVKSLFGGWDEMTRASLPDLSSFDQFPSSPITGIHLWFDRPITELDHAVMVGTISQWLFRDPRLLREPQLRDSPQCEQSRPDQRDSGWYYQVIISASADAIGIGKEALVSQVLDELRGFFPDARSANLLRYRVVTDPESVFSISPEMDAKRPPSRTALDWLFLAGDWVQTGWPATMEGAVISGRMAAAGVLRQLGIQADEAIPRGQSPGWLAKLLIRK
ncbi:hypothetical protein CGZ80_21700 [Rhodopirellula sp. MGV]|nr:hypothetical protein CGZ80_21700 [Rhodopirellula sp. MGV]PNY34657.1 phytoene dehydrogenase [Rhodopirellula baltica]